MNRNEQIKIWQILGAVEGYQEMLNIAIKNKDWQLVINISEHLDKLKERLDALT